MRQCWKLNTDSISGLYDAAVEYDTHNSGFSYQIIIFVTAKYGLHQSFL